MVLLLVIFVAVLIFRIVRKDFAKIVMDEEELEGKEEVGWKKISNDIFRAPRHLNLLCSIVGAGTQLLLLIILLVSLGIVGFYYGSKGGLITAGLFLYAFTSCIAGYISSSLYKFLGGDK